MRNLRLSQEIRDAEDGELRWTLRADLSGTAPGLELRLLSHGETMIHLIELAIALARCSSEFASTILLLDRMATFDSEVLERYVSYLSAPDHLFQTVLVLPYTPADVPKIKWEGWEVLWLKPGEDGTSVVQDLSE